MKPRFMYDSITNSFYLFNSKLLHWVKTPANFLVKRGLKFLLVNACIS